MSKQTIGFAMCGSFCTFEKVFPEIEKLACEYNLIPIMSFNASSIDTRFGNAKDFISKFEDITGNKVIKTIGDAEPIGPKKLLDLLVIAPCTGNTLAKLAYSIADTPVTLAAKSHLRNSRNILIAVSTNDALAGAGKNIGALMNYKNYYFVPFKQDDYIGKPCSAVADMELIFPSVKSALCNSQLEPMVL